MAANHPNYSFNEAPNPISAMRGRGGGGFLSHFASGMLSAKTMEHERGLQSAQHEHEKFMALAGHVMSEEAKQSEHVRSEASANSAHSRNLEFHNTVAKNAAPGTSLNFEHGDLKVNYTTKPARAKAAPAATPAASPAAPSGPKPAHFIGMPSMPPKPTAPAASSAPQPSVTRNPKTGRAMSLKGATGTSTAKTPKNSAAKNTGPTVTRNPKTGRIQSLKTP